MIFYLSLGLGQTNNGNRLMALPIMLKCHHVTYSGYFMISFGAEQQWRRAKKTVVDTVVCYTHLHSCLAPNEIRKYPQ